MVNRMSRESKLLFHNKNETGVGEINESLISFYYARGSLLCGTIQEKLEELE